MDHFEDAAGGRDGDAEGESAGAKTADSVTSSGPQDIADRARLATLNDYRLLDTPADPHFDAIVREATEQFATSMSTITLIDRDRQWFKARVGMDISETPLADSICNHAMRSSDGLVVPDASLDPRFKDMAGVAGPQHIRFYAGMPLTLRNGVRVGTLCVIDTEPRDEFSAEDRALLGQLAQRTVAEFEMERDWRREGRKPGCDAEWLSQAASLLGRASLALQRCQATAALARLEEVISEVDDLRGYDLI